MQKVKAADDKFPKPPRAPATPAKATAKTKAGQ
jgi:hypothetical protein